MPLHLPEAAGPRTPATTTPTRAPGSVRRTSTIDTTRPDGLLGRMVMSAHARDLRTTADGGPEVLGAASIVAEVDGPSRRLQSIETSPTQDGLDALLGVVVGPGFRGKVDAAVPELRGSGSLLYLLLDDLPGAALVSGYAQLRGDVVGKAKGDEYLGVAADLCAGWALDGSMIAAIKEHGQNPAPLGPPAPVLSTTADPHAFHALPELAPTATRRLRRIDVGPGAADGSHPVDVFFRDTYRGEDGEEIVVHEYSVTATVDGSARTVLAIDARPDVLPWMECPQAVASASRLVGEQLAGLRPLVRTTFVGTTTCTHLNDVLRGLADVPSLLDAVDAPDPVTA